MADIVDRRTRSRMMSAIRGKNTRPELTVRRFLHAAGLRYRLHVKTLPGQPDIVLPRYGAVVEVRGCFWHRHPGCGFAYVPGSNRPFWQQKFRQNVQRDRRNADALASLGWRVFVVWECEVDRPRKLRALGARIRRGRR